MENIMELENVVGNSKKRKTKADNILLPNKIKLIDQEFSVKKGEFAALKLIENRTIEVRNVWMNISAIKNDELERKFIENNTKEKQILSQRNEFCENVFTLIENHNTDSFIKNIKSLQSNYDNDKNNSINRQSNLIIHLQQKNKNLKEQISILEAKIDENERIAHRINEELAKCEGEEEIFEKFKAVTATTLIKSEELEEEIRQLHLNEMSRYQDSFSKENSKSLWNPIPQNSDDTKTEYENYKKFIHKISLVQKTSEN